MAITVQDYDRHRCCMLPAYFTLCLQGQLSQFGSFSKARVAALMLGSSTALLASLTAQATNKIAEHV